MEALVGLPPDISRNIWFQILCALFNEFGDADGLVLADMWSHQGGRYDASELRRQWQSIRGGNYKYRLGTILYYAQQFSTRKGGLQYDY